MTHYVYENWTRKKAVTHHGACGSCNEGRGIHAIDSGKSSKWHGPYPDRETAMAFARTLRQPDTRACARCGG